MTPCHAVASRDSGFESCAHVRGDTARQGENSKWSVALTSSRWTRRSTTRRSAATVGDGNVLDAPVARLGNGVAKRIAGSKKATRITKRKNTYGDGDDDGDQTSCRSHRMHSTTAASRPSRLAQWPLRSHSRTFTHARLNRPYPDPPTLEQWRVETPSQS